MAGSWFWIRGVAAALALALAVPGAALGHESIDVGDGRYVIELGFRDEPAYLGLPNAVFVKVEEYATGGAQPVEDLADTLSVEVSKDGQTRNVPLAPKGDGVYEGVLIPTALGDYTFRIFGTVGDAEVDESVTSGPNTFATIEPLSTIEFPSPRPDPLETQAAAAEAQAAANTARTLGIAGIAAGALGVILGALGLARSGRASRPAAAAAAAPASEASGKLIR